MKRLSILVMSLFIGCPASAQDLNFSGRLLASPCTFDTAVSKMTVDLGEYYADQLANPKSSQGYTTFPMTLKNCPEGTTKVIATFSGTEDPDNEWLTMFKNTGTAKNVGIAIKGDNSPWGGGTIKNGTSLTQTVKADHTVSWPMEAVVAAPSGEATPGTVHATITVSFTYQ